MTSFDSLSPVAPRKSLHYIEWLRVVMISLVVAHHAGQAYGPTGGEWPIMETAKSAILGPFFAVNAGFGMGLFFLISGYFTGGSCDRKGSATFAKDRLIRLGIPVVFFSLFVFGPVRYFLGPKETSLADFWLTDYVGDWNVDMGHLWFVAHLLVYSLAYALWRQLRYSNSPTNPNHTWLPSHLAFLGFAVFLGIVGAAVRARFGQDYWVDILWILPAELAHLPQYCFLFIVGIVAGRGAWFDRVSAPVGYFWLGIGLLCAAFAYAVMLGFLPNVITWDHGSTIFALWEAFLCVGMSVGLIVLFREHADASGKLLRFLAPSVFAVYIVHVFVVVMIQILLLPATVGPLQKFAIVTILGVTSSFLIAYLLRRTPGVNRIV